MIGRCTLVSAPLSGTPVHGQCCTQLSSTHKIFMMPECIAYTVQAEESGRESHNFVLLLENRFDMVFVFRGRICRHLAL